MKRPKWDARTFKTEFKVGDCISGWSTGKAVRVTAIGLTRFLSVNHFGDEEVTAMHHKQGWIKCESTQFEIHLVDNTWARKRKVSKNMLKLNGKQKAYVDEWKAQFKVGDLITGHYAMTGEITAIGETRFLWIDATGEERVSAIASVQSQWRKPSERDFKWYKEQRSEYEKSRDGDLRLSVGQSQGKLHND